MTNRRSLLVQQLLDTKFKLDDLKKQEANIKAELLQDMKDDIQKQFDTSEYGCGTATVEVGDFVV